MGSYLQILFALCLVILFFVIGFAVYNYEFLRAMKSSGVTRQRVDIFSGVKDLSTTNTEVYDTKNTASASYRAIDTSYNQDSGTEFTYNFWLYLDNTLYGSTNPTTAPTLSPDVGITSDNIESQTILFTKGSQTLSTYKNVCGANKTDIMVKAPLVKLEENGKNLTIEFNTLQGPEAVKADAPNVCAEQTSDWMIANAHKITLRNFNSPELDKRWNMITVVIEDTSPTDPIPYRYKARCRVYINSLLELDKYVDGKLLSNTSGPLTRGEYSTVKTNTGYFYVAPKVSITTGGTTKTTKLPVANDIKKLMLADLTYFNYALPQAEIDAEQSKGVSNKVALIPGQSMDMGDLTDLVALKSNTKQTVS